MAIGGAGVILQNKIFRHGKILNHPVMHALFGDVGQPGGGALAWGPVGHCALYQLNLTSGYGAQAGDHFGQFALAIATDPSNAEDLTVTHPQ